MEWGKNQYALVRIPVRKPCTGYYVRWYYNGWHYWFFLPGSEIFNTEGEEYRTLGTKKITMSSGQITLGQCAAIRTILNTREIYLYGDSGWANVRVEPGSAIVFDNQINGYEIELTMIIGSKAIYRTGFTPIIIIPVIPPTNYIPPCGEVTIGTQIWMKCNYDSNYPGSKVYNNDESNRAEYGGLYSGDMILANGFCPPGWHVPTLDEWTTLINFIGGLATSAGILKEAGTTHWTTPNTGAVDTYGFAARGTGFGFIDTFSGLLGFSAINERSYFWTKTPNYGNSLWSVYFYYYQQNNEFIDIDKTAPYCPVRLIKDTGIVLTPYIVISTKVHGLFSITLKGTGTIYIDWGDGTVESKVLTGAITVYSHSLPSDSTVTVNNCLALSEVKVSNMAVDSVTVSELLVNLVKMEFSQGTITAFTTHSEWILLEDLILSNNNLSAITLYDWSAGSWNYLDVSYNSLTALVLPSGWATALLWNLIASHNLLTTIDLTYAEIAGVVYFDYNHLSTIIISANEQYWNYVKFNNNSIYLTSFILNPSSGIIQSLSSLEVQSNDLSTFELENTALNLRRLNSDNNANLVSFTPEGGWGTAQPGFRNYTWIGCGLDVTMVNLILTTFDAVAGIYAWKAGDILNISGGTNAAPTGAGITAKNSLIAKGASITTN